MCGITGIVTNTESVSAALDRGQQMQLHRGPDAHGAHKEVVSGWNVGLGHQRLAIIDLTESGAQPMRSASCDGWLVYNGEVYNYRELREELAALGHTFRGSSDTEVVLAALEQWGPREALRRFNGMWAFAWLDAKRQRLVLSRDRIGVKPLYVHRTALRLVFASEIKTVLAMAGGRFAINLRPVADLLANFSLDVSDNTFFEGIDRITPGTFAVVDLSQETLALETHRYWSVDDLQPGEWTQESAPERLRELLTDAVRLRLRSDVPVGVLLSGGIDSSSVAMTMRRLLGPDAELNLISAVSRDPRYDESPFIDRMARHLRGTPHRVELHFTPEEGLRYLDDVCWTNDEPPGNFSVVAGYLLMKRAKEYGITVILSGQGADEILCGYRKYLGFYVMSLLRKGKFVDASQSLWAFWRQGTVLKEFTLGEASRYLSTRWSHNLDVRGSAAADCPLTSLGVNGGMSVQQRQMLDIKRFSLPIITHYEDRVSMAWSRETRCPFLDYRLVEALAPAPVSLKLNHGWTKYVLRQAMAGDLPPEITWRRDKKGFDTPEGEWLRTDFRERVLEIFAPDAMIFRRGFVDRERLLAVYDRYVRQSKGAGVVSPRHVFSSLSLELWLRRYDAFLAS